MAIGINGTLERLQDPYGESGSSLNRARNWTSSYSTTHCVNSPIIHSVKWNTALTEGEEPNPANYVGTDGDVVNVIFDVYQCNDVQTVGTFPADWTLVSSIRKSRDIANISEFDRVYGGDGTQTVYGHVFTVDISEVCRDLLSYSLLPHGKGTYMNPFYGGLNGGAKQQDNLAIPVWSNNFIQTRNGTVRYIRVHYRTEIIDADGIIQEATAAGSYLSSESQYRILNNAPDFDNYNPSDVNMTSGAFVHLGWGTSITYPRQHQSLCPNFSFTHTIPKGIAIAKDVRMTETVETLTWQQGTINRYNIWYNGGYADGTAPSVPPGNPEDDAYGANNTSDLVDDAYMSVRAYDENGVELRKARLYDWTLNLRPREASQGGGVGPNTDPALNCWPRKHNRPCAQNVSPVYINANCIHNNSPVKDVWENGGTTYTRELIDNLAGANDSSSLFLNDEVSYYSVSGVTITTTDGNGTGDEFWALFEHRWYKIDRERELLVNPQNINGYYRGVYYTELRSDYATNANKIRCKGLYYWAPRVPYVRIHWLNKAGGIDSYTFKGDSTTSYNASKDIILRPEPNRFNWGVGNSSGASPYPSDNANVADSYYGDTVRGADVYHGGLEVMNVDSTKSGTVMSLPLNEVKAEWLREIIASPNVWTEYNTQKPMREGRSVFQVPYRSASNINNGSNMSGQQPNNWAYVPIIVTNSSVDTFDSAKGLTTMTLEYTHAHAGVTQRN